MEYLHSTRIYDVHAPGGISPHSRWRIKLAHSNAGPPEGTEQLSIMTVFSNRSAARIAHVNVILSIHENAREWTFLKISAVRNLELFKEFPLKIQDIGIHLAQCFRFLC